MDPLLFSSCGLLFIAATTSLLIYRFGAHKISGTPEYSLASGWTLAFALFLCSFFGSAPFLVGQAPWLLLLPFAGLAISLLTIQRIVLYARETKGNHQAG